MSKFRQILTWFDIHGLFIMSAFLIVFIPLFPKIPIFDVLPGYIVRARPEDILIFLTALIWIKDAIKKRFQVISTYFWLVIFYAMAGATSILLGVLLIQSIPAQLLHIGKSSLHLFRYLEYFALFFFTYSSIKTKKQLKIILALLTFTIITVVSYGFGQEYYKLPLFSTMNREYSKGVTLYLQEGARPQSTFAGHYDLAAYLVIVLPIIFSLALGLFKINLKSSAISIFLHITHILGAWMLVTSGSKTALSAYVVGILVVLIHYLRKLGNLKQQIKWGSIAFITIAISLSIFLSFFARETRDKYISLIKNSLGSSDLPANPDAQPDDLIGDGVVFKQIVVRDENGNESTQWIEEHSSWSPNALKYGLSMGIRLDTLWPNALKGFFNNPLFGNGYSTLAVVDNPGEYSNADSTDNNFFRTIGETGIIGFIIFYGLIVIIAVEIYQYKSESRLLKALKAGFLGSIVGILINAFYIDVFAASKVAYTFWALAGVTLAALNFKATTSINKICSHVLKHWPIYLTFILALFVLHKNPFHDRALIKDLNVSNAQIESLTSAKCYIDTGSFSVCRNNGLVLNQNINIYSILLVPLLIIYDNPMMFYVLNIILITFTVLILYKTIPKLVNKFIESKPKQILIFTSLTIYILICTAVQITNKPLTWLELFLFLVVIPALLAIYTTIIHNIQFRMAYFTQICAVLIATLMLANLSFSSKLLTNYRNDQVSDKNSIVSYANVHFDNTRYLNREHDFFLITTLSPYYLDLFSNGNYDLLPLSESQPYFDQATKVYNLINNKTPLLDQFGEILNNNSLYATDYGTGQNENYAQAFKNLKNTYDLTYVAIGCQDSCSLFTVMPESEKISPEPELVTGPTLELRDLSDKYSFAVVSNRFEPKTILDGENAQGYSTARFTQVLNSNLSYSNNFMIATGDLLTDSSQKTAFAFNKAFNRLPILYSAGNHDLEPEKYYESKNTFFFTESEFFIFLNVAQDSTISSDQQRFLYNALLKLEKLPDIKNIFVVAHNLNWQDKSNPNNVIHDLERKLSLFEDKEKYIISSFHSSESDPEIVRNELTQKHITQAETKTHYLASFMRDWNNDSFFEFTIDVNNVVTVEYRVRGQGSNYK